MPRLTKDLLKPKERAFLLRWIHGASLVDSYCATHENCERNKAYVRASRLKDLIIERIGYNNFLELAGISDAAIAQAHVECLQSADEGIKIRSVKLGYQIRGRYVERTATEDPNGETWVEWVARTNREKKKAQHDDSIPAHDDVAADSA